VRMANEWLAQRLDVLGAMVVFLAAILAIVNRANISPSLAGGLGWGSESERARGAGRAGREPQGQWRPWRRLLAAGWASWLWVPTACMAQPARHSMPWPPGFPGPSGGSWAAAPLSLPL
jgi:hypothetical protein